MKNRPDPEDAELFRRTVGDVKPVVHDRHEPRKRRARPYARFAREDRAAILQESLDGESGDPPVTAADELIFRRAGVPELVLRKLRRGQYRVQGEIDLHGLTVAEAKHALREFVAKSFIDGARCIRVVHGKGLRSGHRGPVVKQAANSVLRRMGVVAAFVSARHVDGGTGALYVLLSSTTT